MLWIMFIHSVPSKPTERTTLLHKHCTNGSTEAYEGNKVQEGESHTTHSQVLFIPFETGEGSASHPDGNDKLICDL